MMSPGLKWLELLLLLLIRAVRFAIPLRVNGTVEFGVLLSWRANRLI
jgi:hypothetical protein